MSPHSCVVCLRSEPRGRGRGGVPSPEPDTGDSATANPPMSFPHAQAQSAAFEGVRGSKPPLGPTGGPSENQQSAATRPPSSARAAARLPLAHLQWERGTEGVRAPIDDLSPNRVRTTARTDRRCAPRSNHGSPGTCLCALLRATPRHGVPQHPAKARAAHRGQGRSRTPRAARTR